MIYLTYSEQPSGVYSSQVSDVCNFLNSELNAKIKLVAIISLHSFVKNREKIRSEVPGAIVFPALPKAKYWQGSTLLFAMICLLTGERTVISRNVFATKIALWGKKLGIVKKVVFDGRGAIAAEWNEYEVVPDEGMKKRIFNQEKQAVLESQFRIAVSSKLINYWNSWYGYNASRHVIIPCTLNSGFHEVVLNESDTLLERNKMGFDKEDIILVYSGSTAGWQSFKTLGHILGNLLNNNSRYKLLFLSAEDENVKAMKQRFPAQVHCKWVNHSEVQRVLAACDYGILYRENSVTNQVASPTKFAEYLSAGLPVIISENLGDYTDFVKNEHCGMIISENGEIYPDKPGADEKQRIMQLAKRYFTKTANKKQYEELMNFINKD